MGWSTHTLTCWPRLLVYHRYDGICHKYNHFDSTRPHQLELEGMLMMAKNGMNIGMAIGGVISGTLTTTGLGTITVNGQMSGGHRLKRTRAILKGVSPFGLLPNKTLHENGSKQLASFWRPDYLVGFLIKLFIIHVFAKSWPFLTDHMNSIFQLQFLNMCAYLRAGSRGECEESLGTKGYVGENVYHGASWQCSSTGCAEDFDPRGWENTSSNSQGKSCSLARKNEIYFDCYEQWPSVERMHESCKTPEVPWVCQACCKRFHGRHRARWNDYEEGCWCLDGLATGLWVYWWCCAFVLRPLRLPILSHQMEWGKWDTHWRARHPTNGPWHVSTDDPWKHGDQKG